MRLLFFLVVLGTTCAPAQTAVAIVVHPQQAGASIPRDFIGLSFESGSLTSATGFPAENPAFQRMVGQLGPGVIRTGGNSVDKLTGWMRGQRTSSTSSSVITSSDTDRLFNFARAVGWRVLFSLNLGHGDPAADADEADYVYSTANDVVLGLEIGNEPDLYKSNGLRPTSYSLSDYIAEWQSYANAIQTRVPAAVLTGPAAAGSILTWTGPYANQFGSRIALLTQHLYPTSPSAVNPNASNVATIPHLLGSPVRTTEDADGSQLLQTAQAQKIPWRMAETNSCYNGGEKGVSDVFASALWGVDYMFTLAGRGSAGVNFHGGGTGTYTPIAVSGSSVTARPLYYALLMFRAAARGRLVPLDVSANGVNLTSYGVLDGDGTLRVAVINKDQAQDASVTISPGAGYLSAIGMRLTAPAIDAASGVMLGSAQAGPNGSWSPNQIENYTLPGGSMSTVVKSGSALLVNFGNGNLAVSNAASGQPVLAPSSLGSAYAQGLGMGEVQAAPAVLPQSLGGVMGTITDASGTARSLPLTYAGPSQVNFLTPDGIATGTADIAFGGLSTKVIVNPVAPGLFSLGGANTAAALAFRVVNGQAAQTQIPAFDCSSGACVTTPIVLDSTSTVYISLYGTGIRGATSAVTCTIGGDAAPVIFAGPQSVFPGLDQVNVAVPASLRGRGDVDVVVSVAGQMSNAVRLSFGG